VIDPNGNTCEIGKATSDAYGTYECSFTPEVPGKYRIIATFDGSRSYYGSTTTYLTVGPAPEPAPVVEIPTPPPTEMYILGAAVAIIIAIAVAAAVNVLMLKKRS
jgi:hypothetical protein